MIYRYNSISGVIFNPFGSKRLVDVLASGFSVTVILSTCPEAGDLTLWQGVRPFKVGVDCVPEYREAFELKKGGVSWCFKVF